LIQIQKPLIRTVATFDSAAERDKMLTTAEWDAALELSLLLAPIEQLTRDLSGVKYTTLSAVIPLYSTMQDEVLKVQCVVGSLKLVVVFFSLFFFL
jgi:hypothetical protein